MPNLNETMDYLISRGIPRWFGNNGTNPKNHCTKSRVRRAKNHPLHANDPKKLSCQRQIRVGLRGSVARNIIWSAPCAVVILYYALYWLHVSEASRDSTWTHTKAWRIDCTARPSVYLKLRYVGDGGQPTNGILWKQMGDFSLRRTCRMLLNRGGWYYICMFASCVHASINLTKIGIQPRRGTAGLHI